MVRVMICGENAQFNTPAHLSSGLIVLFTGDLAWAHKECENMFKNIADVVVSDSVEKHLCIRWLNIHTQHQVMDSPDRSHFLNNLKLGGKYEGIVGLYRHNISADRIGIFDREIIEALAPSVKWIAHNGAGYDQIDVVACKDKGIIGLIDFSRVYN